MANIDFYKSRNFEVLDYFAYCEIILLLKNRLNIYEHFRLKIDSIYNSINFELLTNEQIDEIYRVFLRDDNGFYNYFKIYFYKMNISDDKMIKYAIEDFVIDLKKTNNYVLHKKLRRLFLEDFKNFIILYKSGKISNTKTIKFNNEITPEINQFPEQTIKITSTVPDSHSLNLDNELTEKDSGYLINDISNSQIENDLKIRKDIFDAIQMNCMVLNPSVLEMIEFEKITKEIIFSTYPQVNKRAISDVLILFSVLERNKIVLFKKDNSRENSVRKAAHIIINTYPDKSQISKIFNLDPDKETKKTSDIDVHTLNIINDFIKDYLQS